VTAGSSRFSQLISAEAGEIERRLQALEKRLNIAGARASINARETAENLGDAIASALSGWADRFRQGASTVGDQSAALGRDATKLGTVAVNRIADEPGRRPLLALAVALGVGVLIGMAARNSRDSGCQNERGCGAIRASGSRPAIFSLRFMAGSPRVLTRST
jgi:hypothetical protein